MKGPLFRGGQTGRRGSKGSRVATAPVRTLDYRNTEGKTKPKASRRLPGKGMCHRDLEEAGARQAERCKAAFQIERIQGVKHPWEWLGHQVPGRGEESINQLLLGLQETGWGEGWGRAGVGGVGRGSIWTRPKKREAALLLASGHCYLVAGWPSHRPALGLSSYMHQIRTQGL